MAVNASHILIQGLSHLVVTKLVTKAFKFKALLIFEHIVRVWDWMANWQTVSEDWKAQLCKNAVYS